MAHYVGLNGRWLLQAFKTMVMTYEPPKKPCYFIDCLKFTEYNRLENDSDIFPYVWVMAYSASLLLKLTATNPNTFPRDRWLYFLMIIFIQNFPEKKLYHVLSFVFLPLRLQINVVSSLLPWASIWCPCMHFQGHLNQKHLIIYTKYSFLKNVVSNWVHL